jgi:hypothetical protein
MVVVLAADEDASFAAVELGDEGLLAVRKIVGDFHSRSPPTVRYHMTLANRIRFSHQIPRSKSS